jgi:cyclopropane fatty-acyl-phospholipid synthase-like methyltransferase
MDLYSGGPPPWDIGRPQPAFLALAEAGTVRGRVLDAGCGTGEHVLMCAARGLDATGIDVSATALGLAEEKVRKRGGGTPARFLHRDARQLAGMGESFDTVLDCGLFHALHGPDRAAYVAGLREVLVPGGRYLMMCISDREPGGFARVHGVARADVAAEFGDGGWQVDAIEPASMAVTTDPAGLRAWLVTVTRAGTPC